MSVASISCNELATFATIAIQSKTIPADRLIAFCKLLELASLGNVRAWAETYDDRIEPIDAEDIENTALDMLAGRVDVPGYFGGVTYNCIANNGRAFLGSSEIEADNEIFAGLRIVEAACSKWRDRIQAAETRAEENAEAFNDVGNQKSLSGAEILANCEAAGCQRVITAEFMVNESDCQTDYFNGRSSRIVVIGFGKGKRENFKQLRAAASQFPATAHLGPGIDRYTVSLKWDHDKKDDPERAFMSFGEKWDCNEPRKGESVVFHYYSANFDAEKGQFGYSFSTPAECEAFIQANQPLAGTEWSIHRESIENRENYSMGGGNYLGHHRYSGWQVSSGWIQENGQYEYFEAPKPAKPKRQPCRKPKSDSKGQSLRAELAELKSKIAELESKLAE